MRTLTGLLLAASWIAAAGTAAASEGVDVVTVTAKKPASMISDMTDEIMAETGAALRSEQPPLVAPEIRIELPKGLAERD